MTHLEFATKLGLVITSEPIKLKPTDNKGSRYSVKLILAEKGSHKTKEFESEYWKGSGHLGKRVQKYDSSCERGYRYVWKRCSQKEIIEWEKGYSTRMFGPRPIPPQMCEFLCCVQADCNSLENTPLWEDWADEFGYNKDSISDKKIYEYCGEQYLKLRRFLGVHFYEFLRLEEGENEEA